MKIKEIIVNNLFGMFNHRICVNQDTGITIIIGENGLGKTAILEMIRAVFNKRMHTLYSYEFHNLVIVFDDEVRWNIRKEINVIRIIEYKNNEYGKRIEKSYDISIKKMYGTYDNKIINASRLANRVPYLRRIAENLWRDERTGKELDCIELIQRFEKYYSQNELQEVSEIPSCFEERLSKIDVSLIETQRIFTVNANKEYREPIRMIEKYANNLRFRINRKLTEYTELSAELDRTYPNRLISAIDEEGDNITKEEVMEKMLKLEEKRVLLDKVGLIQVGEELDIRNINLSQNVTLRILSQYVEDSYKKLEIFDEISEKIKLLIDIINRRFKHKRLYINKENGFEVRVINTKKRKEDTIPLVKLSSGEQNELILFYQLIFECKGDSLVLIDEPEISLHISWQNKFVEDLEEIIKINKLNIIIATHSPNIIGDKWDCRVKLKGEE